MINKFFKDRELISIFLSPIFILILAIMLLLLNVYLGIFGIVFFGISAYNSYENYRKRRDEFKEYMDQLDIAFEGFTKNAIFNMPFPIAVLDNDYNLAWYNSKFKTMVGAKQSLIEKKIYNVIPEIETEAIDNKDSNIFNIDYSLKIYEVHTNIIDEYNKENMKLLYFIDRTEMEKVFSEYENEKMAILNIRLDNYEELTTNTSSERRPIVFAEIDSIITSYFHKFGGFIKKNENGRYIAVIHKQMLDEMIDEKFSFVEDIRNVSYGNTITPTLSVGVGYNEENPRLIEKSANGAIEIALGRGGDQIVLKSKDELTYFGGKNQATEKRTKVRARVIAHALSQLIDKSTKIFISGHKNPDMDSLGSSIGLWYAAKKKNKDAYIVLSEVTPAIENLYNYAIEKLEGLKESIITPDKSVEKIDQSSIFIVTDNHRKASVEEERLLEKTDTIVVIDHHRRGSDYIEDAVLNYVEPYASSAAELVTEMLIYMDENPEIPKVVSEALLSGIITDTKHFNQQTGIRTFEAAVVLKEKGADLVLVNKLFSEDIISIKDRAQIIANSEMYKDKYIFGYFEKDIDGSTLVASQAADEMIDIKNVKASFVFTLSKGRVHISARSYGEASVQLIMEKLNGGGHRTMAATQLDTTIDEAKVLLKKAIDEYIEEEKE